MVKKIFNILLSGIFLKIGPFGGCVQEKWTQHQVKSDWGQMAQSDIFIANTQGYLHWGAH